MLGRPSRSRVTEAAGASDAATAATVLEGASRAGDVTDTLDPSGDDRLGAVLGTYRIEALLGEGGMGQVYLAEHVLLGRKVALKLLRPEQALRRSAVARFFQEARIVNRIRHRNIVDVPDLVELPDGTVFIVMELLAGGSLKELLASGGGLDAVTTITIALQVAAALGAAHAVGVLHRDLKPANVHIGSDRRGDAWVKLLDFGIAKLSDAEAATAGQPMLVTGEGAIIGTPAYMSPEQATSEPVDVRSDLYALGLILFEMLAGKTPFVERSLGAYVRAHCSAPVPPLVTPDGRPVPPALDALIRRCLAKAPADRPASVAEVGAALTAILAEVSAPPAVAAPRRRGRWMVAAALLVAAIPLAVLWATPAPAAAPAAPPDQPPTSTAPPAAVVVEPPRPAVAPPDAATPASPPAEPPARERGARSPVRREPRRDAAPTANPGAGSGVIDPAYTTDPYGPP